MLQSKQLNFLQQLPISSDAPTSVLTCPLLTPAPRRHKSLKIKRPTKLLSLPPHPPLTPAPGLLANDPEPPQKAETKKKWREVDENEIIHELDLDLERFIRLN